MKTRKPRTPGPQALPHDIDAKVRELLHERPGLWVQIADAADVSHSWVLQFMRGTIPNAGVDTLRKVRAAARRFPVTRQREREAA